MDSPEGRTSAAGRSGEAVDQDAEVIDQFKLLNSSRIGQGLFLKLPGQVGDGRLARRTGPATAMQA